METDDFKVEYLVLMDSDGAFCNCKESFNKLLQVSSDIKISGSKLIYKGVLDLSYSIMSGEVEGKDQRFFQIAFIAQHNEEQLDSFVSLLRDVRTIINKYGGQPEVLRDDISTYYANKAYPLIHRTENMMRKLIANFMLRKVGKGWLKEAAPDTFKQAVDKTKRKDAGYMNALYQVDFIHLADFLFKPYSVRDINKLYEQINKATKIDELDMEALRDFIPRSNWYRYFSAVVDCDDLFLDKRWKELYELRCIVAHNSIMAKSDYIKIITIVEEVKGKIEKAICEIDKITVPANDQEIVAESVISSINELYGEFIRAWKNLEAGLRQLAIMFGMYSRETLSPDGTRKPILVPRQIFYKRLQKGGIIPEEIVEKIVTVQNFRNQLMHADELYSNSELESNAILAEKCAILVRRAIEYLSMRKAIISLEGSKNTNTDGILRITRVIVIDGNEKSEQTHLIGNTEFTDRETLLKFVCQELVIPEENIEILNY
jgi:hypothetical protein